VFSVVNIKATDWLQLQENALLPDISLIVTESRIKRIIFLWNNSSALKRIKNTKLFVRRASLNVLKLRMYGNNIHSVKIMLLFFMERATTSILP